MMPQSSLGIPPRNERIGANSSPVRCEGPFAHLAIPPVVSIDGGAGTGKSTVAALLARALGDVPVIDSGLWFRALGLTITHLGIPPHNEAAVNNALPRLSFIPGIDDQGRQTMEVRYSYKEDVTCYPFSAEELASTCAGDIASTIGPYPVVRNFLKAKQCELASRGAVSAGRAQGAEVFDDQFQARTSQDVVRVLLHAAPEIRARRRFAQQGALDPSLTFEKILADIKERDRRDTERQHGGLITQEQASTRGYLVINTGTNSTTERAPTAVEVVQTIVTELRKRGLVRP